MRTRSLFISLLTLAIVEIISGQTVDVDVNLNINHKVDTITTFDRTKFVVMHADVIEPEWGNYGGTNAIPDVRKDFLESYDVYLGRNSGPATAAIRNATENPSKPGYALESSIQTEGNIFKSYYDATEKLYEYRCDIVSVGQVSVWPFGDTEYTNFIYSTADTPSEPFGTATGEALSDYLTHFYGGIGQPKPRYFEIINEPLYDLMIKHPNESDPATIFKFHRTVASILKNDHPDVDLGGYCVAFPNFDQQNFSRWEDRWKMFVDSAGALMDFWSVHLYDFPAIGGEEQYRKGSNMEATFDMLDQYSMLKLGITKPYIVSEFGASTHDYQGPWSPYRDWLHMKSVNSMMMQFMERPNMINKAVNFLIIKATWGTTGVNSSYVHRLLRMENEPASLSGNWIYSEMVKTYQLWQDVKGKRVDTYSSDLDVMTDAYVNGNNAYVILNNLDFVDKTVNINLNENSGLNITELLVRNMYLDDADPIEDQNSPMLDAVTYSSEIPTQFTLKSEATIILQYTLSGTVNVDELMTEEKYFSDDYYKAITSGTEYTFNINDVTKGAIYDETILRLGLGRSHDLSLKPKVTVNGTEVEVPDNHRGDNQEDRPVFFGVLEIPVPNYLISTDNVVKVSFTDAGGHISSVTLQNFSFSIKPSRSDTVSGVEIYPASLSLGVAQERQLTARITPENAIDKRVTWSSSDESKVTVDANGKITGIAIGSAIITTTTIDGGLEAICSVTVVADRVPVVVDTIIITPLTAEILETKTLQLSYEVLPVDSDDATLIWSSSDESIATVSGSGLITAVNEGSATITATAHNSEKSFCSVTVINRAPGSISFDNPATYTSTSYWNDESIDITCDFTTTTGQYVDGVGIEFILRTMDENGTVVESQSNYDVNARFSNSGRAEGSIKLRNKTPSNELPSGQYYALWASFTEDDGNIVEVAEEVAPITIISETSSEQKNMVNAMDLVMYPNPANKTLKLKSNLTFTDAKFYNLIGGATYSVNLNSNIIDIGHMSEGVYMVELSNDKDRVITKVIIKH